MYETEDLAYMDFVFLFILKFRKDYLVKTYARYLKIAEKALICIVKKHAPLKPRKSWVKYILCNCVIKGTIFYNFYNLKCFSICDYYNKFD